MLQKGLGLKRTRKSHEKGECSGSLFAIQSIYIPPSMSIFKQTPGTGGVRGFELPYP